MKISFTDHKHGTTPIEHLHASIEGSGLALLTDDDATYEILIKKNAIEEGTAVTSAHIILDIDFSDQIAKHAKETLSVIDADLVERYSLDNVSGELKLFVPYGKLETFYAALENITSITPEEIKELKSFFSPDRNRLGKQTSWAEDPAREREKIAGHFNRTKQSLDGGLVKLVTDLLTQAVTAKTNKLMKNALRGDYSDFNSRLDTPKLTLMEHLQEAKVDAALIENTNAGRYDDDLAPVIRLAHV